MKSHYADIKIKAQKRINIIKGQLDLLNQSLAIQNSLRSLDSVLFERHLETHVVHQLKHEEKKAVTELVTLFKRVNK